MGFELSVGSETELTPQGLNETVENVLPLP